MGTITVKTAPKSYSSSAPSVKKRYARLAMTETLKNVMTAAKCSAKTVSQNMFVPDRVKLLK